ncbi:hypothetical protein BJ508DRAFT_151087 [Ascobolus immersus RN42]|uniref:GRF-type domain-containing protein n=1 Tax=Ascobolus immersus RN42 TaxID=1160509 RepID=A0A3N4HYJ2_ASCIM|nr:hypothetical protein BJ508DRAFT_151087 [Ascobolus immersus RN42]
MTFNYQQNPQQRQQQQKDYTFHGNGPPIFSSGPKPVFPANANAAPPYTPQPPQPPQQQFQAQTPPQSSPLQPVQNQPTYFRSLKGLWDGTQWLCNCNPRKVASKLQVKKDGPTKGKWFYKCGNFTGAEGPDKCNLFLWEDEVMQRQSRPESDPAPSGSMNTATNVHAPAALSYQPNNGTASQFSQPSYQLPYQRPPHQGSGPGFGSGSGPIAQGFNTTAGLTTPATSPTKRPSSGPSNIRNAYRPATPDYGTPLHSPSGSPPTFSQRVQPQRQAKSPKGKTVAFDKQHTDEEEEEEDEEDTASGSEYESETNTSTTEDVENDDDDEESSEEEVPSAQPRNDIAPIRNYDSDITTDSEDEDNSKAEKQLGRDLFQSKDISTSACSSSQPPAQKLFKAPAMNGAPTRQTQHTKLIHPDTSDSEEDRFVTPRSSVEPTSQEAGTTYEEPIITAETTTTTTRTGPYSTIYQHTSPRAPLTPTHRPYRPITPATPTTPKRYTTPNPALTASPMPEKGKFTKEVFDVLSKDSITLSAERKAELERVLERQYRRESANLKAKERLRLLLQERDQEIERLQNQLAEAEINSDLVPVFTKTSLVTEKKTDRTYYRRKSEAEKLV